MMNRLLVVFGTRPETIKMAPIVGELSLSRSLAPVVCAVAQHRAMLDQVVAYFGLKPDFDLDLMKPGQSLNDVVGRCVSSMAKILDEAKPAMVLVQGDTTTAMASALAAFNAGIRVAHIEAGLRTHDKFSPFPEEMNRKLIGAIADLHFAPTEKSAANLRNEGIRDSTISVTGNTGVDAFLQSVAREERFPELEKLYQGRRMVLLTAHRRESFGEPLERILGAVREFLFDHEEMHVIYPVHPNPSVKSTAQRILGDVRRVSLVSPVSYGELIFLMKECQFLLTDSGGIQEEAPSIGKPVVVLRESTERMEAIEAGAAMLVGSDRDKILGAMRELSDGKSSLYQSMSQARNPFGDGTASKQVVRILESFFAGQEIEPKGRGDSK